MWPILPFWHACAHSPKLCTADCALGEPIRRIIDAISNVMQVFDAFARFRQKHCGLEALPAAAQHAPPAAGQLQKAQRQQQQIGWRGSAPPIQASPPAPAQQGRGDDSSAAGEVVEEGNRKQSEHEAGHREGLWWDSQPSASTFSAVPRDFQLGSNGAERPVFDLEKWASRRQV